MENIIAPLPRLVLEKELSDKFFFFAKQILEITKFLSSTPTTRPM